MGSKNCVCPAGGVIWLTKQEKMLPHQLKFFTYIHKILAKFWWLLYNTIYGANILLKYFWFWTREFWKTSKFQIFYLIKVALLSFLTYFRYSPVLLLNRTYITLFFNTRKGGLMTVDDCWKIAIFNQNSNLYTLRNWQKGEKKS